MSNSIWYPLLLSISSLSKYGHIRVPLRICSEKINVHCTQQVTQSNLFFHKPPTAFSSHLSLVYHLPAFLPFLNPSRILSFNHNFKTFCHFVWVSSVGASHCLPIIEVCYCKGHFCCDWTVCTYCLMEADTISHLLVLVLPVQSWTRTLCSLIHPCHLCHCKGDIFMGLQQCKLFSLTDGTFVFISTLKIVVVVWINY